MKKKLLTTALMLLISISLITATYGGASIKLLINGKEIKTPVELQTVKGNIMAPVKSVAEALGAKVSWDTKTNTIKVDAPKPDISEKEKRQNARIADLESVLIPIEPKEAVEKWALGVKKRNGALQYAVLSADMKKQMYSQFEESYWCTGFSSPWVESYRVDPAKVNMNSYEYRVEMTTATSTGYAGTVINTVTVKRENGGWYISNISKPEYQQRKEIKLRAYPQAVYELKTVNLKEIMGRMDKKLTVKGVGNVIGYYYNLPGKDTLRMAIEYNGVAYDTGVEMPKDSGSLYTQLMDLTGDGRDELVYTIRLNPSLRKTWVVSYDGKDEKWKRILEVKDAYIEDIDEDNRPEVISTTMGSQTGYVTIYVWGGICFNQYDPAKDTGGTYTAPIQKDGKKYIEIGINDKVVLYKYRNGSLITTN